MRFTARPTNSSAITSWTPTICYRRPVLTRSVLTSLVATLAAPSGGPIISTFLDTKASAQPSLLYFHLDPVGAGFEPTILVADLFSSGGIQGGVHYYREQHFQAAENLTSVRGNHSFKFGGEFEPVWISAQTTFFTPGAGIFTPQSFFGAPP